MLHIHKLDFGWRIKFLLANKKELPKRFLYAGAQEGERYADEFE